MNFHTAQLVPSRQPAALLLVEVLVASIAAKQANKLIKLLSTALPIPDLRHLKRVKKSSNKAGDCLDILLCRAGASTGSGAGVAVPPEAAGVLQPFQLEPFVAHVPLHPPETRQQWEEWGKFWPITWKVPENPVATGDDLLAKPQDQAYFEQHMAAAVRLARAHGTNNAAMIVDPISGECIAAAVDSIKNHPLDHAAMVAIKLAAEADLQKWPLAEPANAADNLQNAGGSSSPALPTAMTTDVQHGENILRTSQPAGTADGQVVKRQRCDDGPASGGAQEEEAQTSALTPPGSRSSPAPSGKPYMCTGYDCFLIREPCVMCAMGLVHSRLQRVVYCKPDTQYGALGGCFHLMAQKSLNHHYEVYKMELVQEQ